MDNLFYSRDEEDEDVKQTIYLIKETNKDVVYTTTYQKAKNVLLDRFHLFLKKNSNSFLRIDKEDDKISVYERNQNSLQPFQELMIFQCEFVRIEKQN